MHAGRLFSYLDAQSSILFISLNFTSDRAFIKKNRIIELKLALSCKEKEHQTTIYN